MSSSKQRCSGRRFGEQGRAAVRVLQEHGVTDYQFSKGKHAAVAFSIGDADHSYRFACTPRSAGNSARQVQRELAAIISKARGGAAEAPEKRAAPEIRNHPERHPQMLQESMVLPSSNGKSNGDTSPLFYAANAGHARRAEAWLSDRIEKAKKLPASELISEVVEITPAMAELILLKHNAGNRNISVRRVETYAEAISDGRWKLTSQGISFSRGGNLNNGQHRLSAIVAAGRPVPMQVTFGEDRAVFDILDVGKARTASDALNIAGYKNTVVLAAAARLLLQIDSGKLGLNQSFPNDVIREAVRVRHPALTDMTTDGMKVAASLKCSGAVTTAGLYLIAQNSGRPQRLDDFIERLRNGAGLSKGDAILVLRDGMQKKTIGATKVGDVKFVGSSAARYISQTAAFIKAWNLWLTGRRASPQSLTLHKGEEFPQAD